MPGIPNAIPDFDDALAAIAVKPGAKSRMVAILTHEVDEIQAAKIEAKLRDPQVAHRAISRAITAMGLSCSEAAVVTWRKNNGIRCD